MDRYIKACPLFILLRSISNKIFHHWNSTYYWSSTIKIANCSLGASTIKPDVIPVAG